jgi:hypothetical protein
MNRLAITPLEAMACSTPVIGADVGGIRYSVAHGETGLLVPPKDPLAVAQGLVMLKHDPQRAQRMGAAGLARAKEMFTWESVADTLSGVYPSPLDFFNLFVVPTEPGIRIRPAPAHPRLFLVHMHRHDLSRPPGKNRR